MGDSMRLLAVPLLALSLLGSACPAEEIVVFADSHAAASEGVVGRDLQWGGLAVCHGQGGFQAWRFDATHAGPYTLRAYYASQDSRAVEVFMNGSLRTVRLWPSLRGVPAREPHLGRGRLSDLVGEDDGSRRTVCPTWPAGCVVTQAWIPLPTAFPRPGR